MVIAQIPLPSYITWRLAEWDVFVGRGNETWLGTMIQSRQRTQPLTAL